MSFFKLSSPESTAKGSSYAGKWMSFFGSFRSIRPSSSTVLPAVRSESRDSFGLSVSALPLSDKAAEVENVGHSQMTVEHDETCSVGNDDADHSNEAQRQRSSSAEEEGGCFDLSSWPSIQVIPLQRSVKLVSRTQQFRLANPNLPVSPRDHPARSSTPPALLLREKMSARFTETKTGKDDSLTEQ